MQHPAYRRRIAALAEARAELESSVVDGDSPYAIAYRELVVEYGAALVAKAMYVVDHEHDPRRIAEIARKHYEKMAYLAGIDQINERFGASSTKAGRAA